MDNVDLFESTKETERLLQLSSKTSVPLVETSSGFKQSEWSLLRKASCLFIIVIAVVSLLSLIFAVLVPEGCSHFDTPAVVLPDPIYLGNIPPDLKNKVHFVVQFHGDSNMADPEVQGYEFHNRIYSHLQGYNFTIYNFGSNARPTSTLLEMINGA